MKKLNYIVTILLILCFAFCRPEKKKDNLASDSTSKSKAADKEKSTELTTSLESNIEGYTFKYGYLKYDEEKYGFANPGFLNVYKNNELIYTDSFKGEGPVTIESLGYHDLDGQKLVFRLNYGTEGCDYAYTSKYYVANKNQIVFLKESYSFTGGDLYSSRFYEHFFPTDSIGQPNSILIVEGQIFHEKDQADRFDTSYIKFANGRFEISKPTDNLSKVR